MSLLFKLPTILEESRIEYQKLISEKSNAQFSVTELCGGAETEGFSGNVVAMGDNAAFMKFLLSEKKMKGKLDLIYIDPPFFSRADYGAEIKLKDGKDAKIPVMKQKAYHDTWENGMEEYLRMLTPRLLLMKDLLSENGGIWIHLDWHATHYIKVLMDEIFGEKNFINEIIWQYKSGGVSKRHFAKKHDTLLFYAKSPKYYFAPMQEKSYNREFKPYRFKGVKEYKDEIGWYTMVNRKDVWSIDMVGRTSAERTGYVTQKPEALISRIMESCTAEGDLCADFFGGSGTMAATAEKMGRRWISCDIGRLATINTHKRLSEEGAAYAIYEQDSLKNAAEGNGKLKAIVKIEADGISDKKLLSVELLSYEPKTLETIPVEKKFIPVIQKLLKKDSLQFIAYWSLDKDYHDGISRPEVCFSKKNDKLETTYQTLGTDFGVIGIKAVDIFGNIAFLSVDLPEKG